MNRYIGEQPSMERPPRGKKTQDFIDKQRKRDWLSRAYWDQGTFHIPPECIEAMLSAGARKFRGGQDFKRATMILENFLPLRIFTGPDDTKGHFAKGELDHHYIPDHIDIRGVVMAGGKTRVDRCRPIFRHWGLEFSVSFDEAVVTAEQISQALVGCNVGDFRPRFGQFTVVQIGAGMAAKVA